MEVEGVMLIKISQKVKDQSQRILLICVVYRVKEKPDYENINQIKSLDTGKQEWEYQVS